MKKKLTIIGLVLAFVICLLPLPRKVDCDTENIVIDGVYFDFLFCFSLTVLLKLDILII